MKKTLFCIALLICTSINIAIAEEPAYVTDSLKLRLYAEASDKSEIIQTMQSGESVEVLETKGAFSRVRSYDNSVGWVKSAFLVKETPPSLLYYAVNEENKELKQTLQQLESKLNDVNNFSSTAGASQTDTGKITQLEENLQQQREENQNLEKQLTALQKKNDALSEDGTTQNMTAFNKVAYHTSSLTLEKFLFFIAALLIFLIFGMILGARNSSRRMRKRLHGFTLE